jgi:hypothetical protein
LCFPPDFFALPAVFFSFLRRFGGQRYLSASQKPADNILKKPVKE